MKKYQVIYADPPWRYSFSKSKSRKIENQYPTMTVDDICKMDIPIDDNAVLYLWATAPKLLEALKGWSRFGNEVLSDVEIETEETEETGSKDTQCAFNKF